MDDFEIVFFLTNILPYFPVVDILNHLMDFFFDKKRDP